MSAEPASPTDNTTLIARVNALVARVMQLRPLRVFTHYSNSGGPLLAGGLAYQSLFAIFAAIWVLFAVFGFILRANTDLQTSLVNVISTSVPGLIGDDGTGILSVKDLLESSVLSWTGAIAAAGLLFTALGWLASTRQAVRLIFDLPPDTTMIVIAKLKDLGLAIGFGLVLVVSAVLSVASTQFIGGALDLIGISSDSVVATTLGTVIGLLLMLALDTVTLAALFRVLSGVPIPWKRLFVGSLIGGVALGVMKVLGSALLGGATRNPLLASFALILGLLIWFNLICQVILLSASWIAIGMKDLGISARRLKPEEVEAERTAQEEEARRIVAEADRRRLEEQIQDARGWRRRRLTRELNKLER